jgi:hypothetical protein
VSKSEFLHSKNIENFRGCTVVEGNLKILKVSFDGYAKQMYYLLLHVYASTVIK